MVVDMIWLQFDDYKTTKDLIVLPGNKKNNIKNISMVNVFGLLAVHKKLSVQLEGSCLPNTINS